MTLDQYILTLISYYPCTGYDIRVESEHKGTSWVWSGLSFGTIYPRLQKLEKDGYIFTYEAEKDGRRKKVYDLTEKGWQALYQWAEEPAQKPLIRDELMVKLQMIRSTRPEDRKLAIRHLNERKAYAKDLLAYYEEWPRNNYSAVDEYGMIAIEHAKAMMQAELGWIESTIEQLQGPPRPPVQDPNGLIAKQAERRKKGLGFTEK